MRAEREALTLGLDGVLAWRDSKSRLTRAIGGVFRRGLLSVRLDAVEANGRTGGRAPSFSKTSTRHLALASTSDGAEEVATEG
jgi:hypothetical protein